MDRRNFLVIGGGGLLALYFNQHAQGQVMTRRIGILSGFARADIENFLSQLRPELEKLGWTEGRNFVLTEPRASGGDNARLPSLAAGLVAEGSDLFLVGTVPATRALMQATKSIPIVMVGVGNPVDLGIVAGYVKPGGNVTGSSYLANEYVLKLLQLLKEAAPRLRSVALFINPTNEAAAPMVKHIRTDTAAFGMQPQFFEVSGKGDFDAAFAAIRKANMESILLVPEPLIQSNREAIAAFAQTQGLPLASVGSKGSLPASGLIGYGPAPGEHARLTARYIDQILRGANPGDLSIE